MSDVENIVDGCERVEVAGPDGTPRAWSAPARHPRRPGRVLGLGQAQGAAGDHPGETYRDDVALFQERCAAGDYTWGSPLDTRRLGSGVGAVLMTEEGMHRLLLLLLRKAHGSVSEQAAWDLLAAGGEDLGAAIARAIGLPVPNRPAPAPTEVPGTKVESPTPTRDLPTAT
jgi:hypothetical protein